VTRSVREPANFGAGGVKYVFPVTRSRMEPYVMGGVGIAKLTKDVTFSVSGADVTSQLAALDVQLGSDLSGDFSKAMIVFGAGVDWPFWRQFVVGIQFRVNRIGAENDTAKATTVGRVGAAVGIRF
jgi:opacity protein-like surface antigen